MKKVYYNKLIRDNIPAKIKNLGGSLKVRTLKPKEFEKELLKKLAEESLGGRYPFFKTSCPKYIG